MSHISDTLVSSSVDIMTDNILIEIEQFCDQIQECIATLSRHRSNNDPMEHWLCGDEWVENLKYFELFLLKLLKRHVNFAGSANYFSNEIRSSPAVLESATKMR